MRNNAQYAIVNVESSTGFLVIRDLYPTLPLAARGKTVTNDAERVVAELQAAGLLDGGRRLLCYDSDGELDEITFDGGRIGFKVWRKFPPRDPPRLGLEGFDDVDVGPYDNHGVPRG